tara:strand:+ start:721 stop:870 length:150 start_codon:yes stop_codon:yes gene_type:complete
MVKAKTVKKNITITPEQWEIAKTESVKVFGQENVSGYIGYLITNSKSEK